MTRDWYKTLVLLMWLALPLTALNYWRAWDQLPARMAVHFDANWQPNGYTSREGALELGLGILVVMLVLCTVAALVSRALRPIKAWPTLILSYAILGFLCYGNNSIIEFNLKAQSPQSEYVGPTGKAKNPTLTAKSAVRVGHPTMSKLQS